MSLSPCLQVARKCPQNGHWKWGNLVIEIWPERLSANQIAWFLKLSYLLNRLFLKSQKIPKNQQQWYLSRVKSVLTKKKSFSRKKSKGMARNALFFFWCACTSAVHGFVVVVVYVCLYVTKCFFIFLCVQVYVCMRLRIFFKKNNLDKNLTLENFQLWLFNFHFFWFWFSWFWFSWFWFYWFWFWLFSISTVLLLYFITGRSYV